MKKHLWLKRVLLLIGQLLVLLLCLGYVYYVYNSYVKPEKQISQIFLKTECFLLSKKLSTHSRIFHQYRADFRVSYEVNNVQYTRWVSGNGLDHSFTSDETLQEETLAQFDDGGTYPCWYDPEEPGVVVLVKQYHWTFFFSLLISGVIFIICLYYFLRTLFRGA
jgi:hypothetical protein